MHLAQFLFLFLLAKRGWAFSRFVQQAGVGMASYTSRVSLLCLLFIV